MVVIERIFIGYIPQHGQVTSMENFPIDLEKFIHPVHICTGYTIKPGRSREGREDFGFLIADWE